MSHGKWNVVDALVITIVMAVAVSLLVAGAERNRELEMRAENNSQLRGIHQAMVIFAQWNNSYFPGLSQEGELIYDTTAERLEVLLRADHLTGTRIQSPAEPGLTAVNAWHEEQEASLSHEQFSYAMLEIGDEEADAGRRTEWYETLNAKAVVLSDRNTGHEEAEEDEYRSIWTYGTDTPGWQGSVVFNDNSTHIATSHEMETSYGRGPTNEADSLFAASGPDEALMTFSKDPDGNERLIPPRE